ncbi:MAG: carboxypeptidase-like regulatory domain-containing protein [Ferruginibacter sp.]
MLPVVSQAQYKISGTVYDSTKIYPVEGVEVKNLAGEVAFTDSLGRYSISIAKIDSLCFSYRDKATLKFATSNLNSYQSFDIALHIQQKEKYRQLKEVRVNTKSYRQDSVNNRERYAQIFNYKKPGVASSINPATGAVGMDLAEFINMFRFRRNKQMRKMQERLLEQEQDRYVDYKFNKMLVKRITQFQGKDLENFMKIYRPKYEFATESDLIEFYQYILNASYEFKRAKELMEQQKTTK